MSSDGHPSVVDGIPTPVLWLDLELKISGRNAAFVMGIERQTGKRFSTAASALTLFSDLLSQNERAHWGKALADTLNGVSGTQELRLQANGNESYYEVCFHPLNGPAGILGAVITFIDVTRSKEAALKAKQSEALLSAVIDHTPTAIHVKDVQGRYVLINRQYEAMFNVDRRNIVGLKNHEIFPKPLAERFDEEDREVLQSDAPLQREEEVLRSDGMRHFISNRFPLLNDHGWSYAVCGISTDITEKVAIQRQIEEQRAAMAFSSRLVSLGEMAGGIAHEINSPLAIIQMRAEQLADMVTEDSSTLDRKSITEASKVISSTINRISKIIRGLLNFARDCGSDPYKPASVKTLIEETLALCHERLKAHGVELRLVQAEDSLTVECRPGQILQVLINLLNNACDALKSQDKKWIRIDVCNIDKFVEISVEDSGSGIPEALREKIMQPFFTTKPIGEGTGLGLSISKGILENHQGTLSLDTLSPNTRFVIRLKKTISTPEQE